MKLCRALLTGLSALLACQPLLAQAPQVRALCTGLVSPAAREQALQALNERRSLGGRCGARGAFDPAPPMAWSERLQAVAALQAGWLAQRNELGHVGPQGQGLGPRAVDAGYRYARIAENLALGQFSLPEALEDWTHSEGHCANLLDPSLHEVGLACALVNDERAVWVMVVARPRP